MGRMLLSHNFNLNHNELPALKREDFAQVFIDGLKDKTNISCSYIKNPHWVVEILFPKDEFEAAKIGQICGDILTSKRKQDLGDAKLATDTLILGGKKTTPASSSNPNSLQPGEWGVDVVETIQAHAFLASINWDNLTADKSGDDVFKIELLKD